MHRRSARQQQRIGDGEGSWDRIDVCPEHGKQMHREELKQATGKSCSEVAKVVIG